MPHPILPMIHLCTSDVAGKLRGKALPAAIADDGGELVVGWTPTNVQITCFDNIAESPFGALGDLVLVGDPATRAKIDFGDDGVIEDFALGDVLHLDGRPWECCTRSILKAALERLEASAGLTLFGAFEHEFHLPERIGGRGEGYALSAFRSERRLLETIMAAVGQAGIEPESIMKEYGPNQFEVTVKPVSGHGIADQAAVLREIVRACGERLERFVSFAPLVEPDGIGNGVHIHLSFKDADGRPATYDAAAAHDMSAATGAFIAGVLKHLPAIVAFLAPSVVSYGRLIPHRWSAAFNNLGAQDREAAIRLCPIRKTDRAKATEQFNFEIRACDAAASPHLALAAVVHAGVSGIEAGLAAPEATGEDLSLLDEADLEARGLRRLPTSLAAALDELDASSEVRAWFPNGFTDIYLAHKRDEVVTLRGRDDAALCRAYQDAY
ncbi:MAG: glutamine synthetase family protein [Alphaproteobacteria bacterium]|nr:glutamine synthetase family protein [Alphaproteobacteria bacterium]